MSEREEKFEKMLQGVQEEYDVTISKMEKLKTEGKTKTVTYRQLMSTKLTLQNMLSRYEIYGLLDKCQGLYINRSMEQKTYLFYSKNPTACWRKHMI